MKIGEAPWSEAVFCDPETPVAEAVRLMERHDADGVIVMHGRGLPVGSFGRDQIAGGAVPEGVSREEWPVGPSAVVCAFAFEPETRVAEALRIMRRRHISVAPVRCGGQIVAAVSRRRLAAALAAWQLRKRLVGARRAAAQSLAAPADPAPADPAPADPAPAEAVPAAGGRELAAA